MRKLVVFNRIGNLLRECSSIPLRLERQAHADRYSRLVCLEECRSRSGDDMFGGQRGGVEWLGDETLCQKPKLDGSRLDLPGLARGGQGE